MSTSNLKKELDFFKRNQQDLVSKYDGKFLVIKDEEIKGAYGTEIEAYSDAKSKFELGTFLIQECRPGENSYTQTFHSRALFH